jgi:hypothetical protein
VDAPGDLSAPAEAPVIHTTADRHIPAEGGQRFSDRELTMLGVQLIQPAVLVVLITVLFVYAIIGTLPLVPQPPAGVNVWVTGILCLAAGLVAGALFFFLAKRTLANSRFR